MSDSEDNPPKTALELSGVPTELESLRQASSHQSPEELIDRAEALLAKLLKASLLDEPEAADSEPFQATRLDDGKETQIICVCRHGEIVEWMLAGNWRQGILDHVELICGESSVTVSYDSAGKAMTVYPKMETTGSLVENLTQRLSRDRSSVPDMEPAEPGLQSFPRWEDIQQESASELADAISRLPAVSLIWQATNKKQKEGKRKKITKELADNPDNCAKCGSPLPPQAKFCHECSAPQGTSAA